MIAKIRSLSPLDLCDSDASRTAWGWKNHVEPGKISTNKTRSKESLNELIQLVNDHPEIKVQVGHQSL